MIDIPVDQIEVSVSVVRVIQGFDNLRIETHDFRQLLLSLAKTAFVNLDLLHYLSSLFFLGASLATGLERQALIILVEAGSAVEDKPGNLMLP